MKKLLLMIPLAVLADGPVMTYGTNDFYYAVQQANVDLSRATSSLSGTDSYFQALGAELNNLEYLYSGDASASAALRTAHSTVDQYVQSVMSDQDATLNRIASALAYMTELHAIITEHPNYSNYLDRVTNELAFITSEYCSYVKSRLKTPSEDLPSLLYSSFTDARSRILDVLYDLNDYSVGEQLSSLNDSWLGGYLDLSNEGYLLAEQVAMQQRDYLCSVAALQRLDAITNFLSREASSNVSVTNLVEMGWITNYLNTVQRPYYALWDNLLVVNRSTNPYRLGPMESFTNFVADPKHSTFNAFANYKDHYDANTNLWRRLEYYLLNMQGLIPMGSTSSLPDQSEVEESSQMISDLTTSVSNTLYSVESISNDFSRVLAEFKALLQDFNISESLSGYSHVYLTPTFTFQGSAISFEGFSVDLGTTAVAKFRDGCRFLFTCVWWLTFSAIGFHLFCKTVLLLGKSIAHIALIIGTFLH